MQIVNADFEWNKEDAIPVVWIQAGPLISYFCLDILGWYIFIELFCLGFQFF